MRQFGISFSGIPSVLSSVILIGVVRAQDESSGGEAFTTELYNNETFSFTGTEIEESETTPLATTQISIKPICRCSDLMSEAATGRGWSGNPGYIQGLPIRTGKLVQKAGLGGVVKQAILVPRTKNSGLTILAPSFQNLHCPSSSDLTSGRLSIAFQEDTQVQCQWTWPEWTTCSQVQANITRILLGMDEEEIAASWRIGAWGNSASERLGDWLGVSTFHKPRPLYATSPGTCFASRELLIIVLYAKEGSVQAPQAKIAGVAYIWEPALPLAANTIWLKTRVQFRDVSSPPHAHFAPPLALRARLPHDFFYPFFLSSAPPLSRYHIIAMCIVSSTIAFYSNTFLE